MLPWRSHREPVFEQPDDDYINGLSQQRGGIVAPENDRINNNEKSDDSVDCDDWKVAFRGTCLELGSLRASPQQVLDFKSAQEGDASIHRPAESQVVYWSQHNTETVVSAVVKAYRDKQKVEQQQRRSNGWLTRVATAFYKIALSSDADNENVEEYLDEYDDYQAEQSVEWQVEIYNVDLAVQCIQQLMTTINNYTDPIVLLLEGDDTNCFIGWMKANFSTNDLLSKLADDEINVLVSALVDLEQARVVDGLLVLGSTTSTDSNYDEIAVARFRLESAIQHVESSIHRWTGQRDAALMRAKETKSKTAALAELRRKVMYEKHMEHAHVTMLNLEQTQQAIDLAHSQAQLTKVLQATVSILQTLNREVSLDQVQDVAMDLTEELQALKDINQHLILPGDNADADDDLLKELEALTINDSPKSNVEALTINDSPNSNVADEPTYGVSTTTRRLVPTGWAEAPTDGFGAVLVPHEDETVMVPDPEPAPTIIPSSHESSVIEQHFGGIVHKKKEAELA